MSSFGLIEVALLLSALGSGLIAGFLFAFSVCVMRALAKLPAAQGIAAMQSINVVVIRPLFLIPFLGTAFACVLVILAAVRDWRGAESATMLTGGLLYLLGTFGVTMAANVPRNTALAAVDPATPEGTRVWEGYLRTWTAWNHIRTVAAFAAAAAFVLALAR
jgi:uncharacterized membrane protein